jgi:hypothetical protein
MVTKTSDEPGDLMVRLIHFGTCFSTPPVAFACLNHHSSLSKRRRSITLPLIASAHGSKCLIIFRFCILTKTPLFYQKDVDAYFVKAMRHYSDKEILVVSFNTSNLWVTLAISIKYDHTVTP